MRTQKNHGLRSSRSSSSSVIVPSSSGSNNCLILGVSLVRTRANPRTVASGKCLRNCMTQANSVAPRVITSSKTVILSCKRTDGESTTSIVSQWVLTDGRLPGGENADFLTGLRRRSHSHGWPSWRWPISSIRSRTGHAAPSLTGACLGAGTIATSGPKKSRNNPLFHCLRNQSAARDMSLRPYLISSVNWRAIFVSLSSSGFSGPGR